MPWGVWRRPGAMCCDQVSSTHPIAPGHLLCVETWCHGLRGGDLVPLGVWRRPGAMECVWRPGAMGCVWRPGAMECAEETWCHGVCGGD